MEHAKFRGKLAYDTNVQPKGTWVDGSYTYNLCNKRHKIITFEGQEFVVDSATVGQYIGIEDINKAELYGNDIVECKSFSPYPLLIVWHRAGFSLVGKHYSFDYKEKSIKGDINFGFPTTERIKKIGNKIDNPELLK